MSTTDEEAPVAHGSLGRGADSPIRARRISLGLTRKELAAQVGLSESALAGIQNGHHRPSLESATRIADALDAKVEDLFKLRECKCGRCGELTTANFLSGHNTRLPEHGATVARGHRARRMRLGIPEEKICKRCGRTFTRSEFPNLSDANWLARNYCDADCYWPVRVEPRPCRHCGVEFKPDENRRHYCPGTSHGQLARWQRLFDIPDAVIDALPPRARKALFGKKKLIEVREQGQHAKGKAKAEATLKLVRAALMQKPDLTRREVVEALMHLEGEDVLYVDRKRRTTRDPVYQAARKKVERRLQRGFELAGEPAELRHLL